MTDSDHHDSITASVARFMTGLDTTRGQAQKKTKPAMARARKCGGRPRKVAAGWAERIVPPNIREIATTAAEKRGMTVGDWISEAVIAFSKEDAIRVSADVSAVNLPSDLVGVMKDVQDRLTELEARNTRGLLGMLFNKGSWVER